MHCTIGACGAGLWRPHLARLQALAVLTAASNSVRYWCSTEKYRLFGAQLAIQLRLPRPYTTSGDLSHAIKFQSLQTLVFGLARKVVFVGLAREDKKYFSVCEL